MSFDLDAGRVREGALYLLALILSICVHEFGHAFVADKLGDPLPREQGRVTLNPLAHVDPVGTLLMPVMAFVFGGGMLGWGKPVQVSLSARSISRKVTLRTADLFISAAGPAMNIVFALVLSLVFIALDRSSNQKAHELSWRVAIIIQMNVGLAFFNLIPCPPLDGGHILRAILPRSLARIPAFLDRYGSLILIALLMSSALRWIMWPAGWLTAHWLDLIAR
jgi:Zn-dependent protease